MQHTPTQPKPVVFRGLDWFLANFDALVREYNGQWLAISDDAVVAHADTPDELGRKISELGIMRPFVVRAHPDAWRSIK